MWCRQGNKRGCCANVVSTGIRRDGVDRGTRSGCCPDVASTGDEKMVSSICGVDRGIEEGVSRCGVDKG